MLQAAPPDRTSTDEHASARSGRPEDPFIRARTGVPPTAACRATRGEPLLADPFLAKMGGLLSVRRSHEGQLDDNLAEIRRELESSIDRQRTQTSP